MKSSLCTLFFLCFITLLQAQIVHIPDSSFKAALLANVTFVNINGDNEIQLSEAQAAHLVSVPNKGIRDLTGIENFINVRVLNFYDNNVTSADLRNLTKLQHLYCLKNQLTSLQLAPTASKLRLISASYNNLTSLVLPDTLDLLKKIYISHNQLTDLDLSAAHHLELANLTYNRLTNLSWSTTGIETILCSHNQFSTFKIQQPITYIDCSNNPMMDSLWFTAPISGSMSKLICDSSRLVYLNINESVDSLYCNDNLLTSLVFSMRPGIKYIKANSNKLKRIVFYNSSIKDIDIRNNELERLTIYNNAANNIINLNTTNNPDLYCIQTNRSIANAQANWVIDNQTTIASNCYSTWNSINTLSSLSEVSIYPNPTTSDIQLDLGQIYETVNILVYNSLGQQVNSSKQQHSQQATIVLPKAKGLYLLQVQTEKGQKNFNVIKQ